MRRQYIAPGREGELCKEVASGNRHDEIKWTTSRKIQTMYFRQSVSAFCEHDNGRSYGTLSRGAALRALDSLYSFHFERSI
jgi:hypothetical protein